MLHNKRFFIDFFNLVYDLVHFEAGNDGINDVDLVIYLSSFAKTTFDL